MSSALVRGDDNFSETPQSSSPSAIILEKRKNTEKEKEKNKKHAIEKPTKKEEKKQKWTLY